MQLTPQQKQSLCERLEIILNEIEDHDLFAQYKVGSKFMIEVQTGALCDSYSLLDIARFAKRMLLKRANILADNREKETHRMQTKYDDLANQIDSLHEVYEQMEKDLARAHASQESEDKLEQLSKQFAVITSQLEAIVAQQNKILQQLSSQAAKISDSEPDHSQPAKRNSIKFM